MRKSLASLVGNIGNTIGISTPSLNINKKNLELDINNNDKGDVCNNICSNYKLYTSPSRPLGLPPPLPYTKENDDNLSEISKNLNITSSLDNTRILTPFRSKNTINKNVYEDDFNNINLNTLNNDNTPLTKSMVRIKSIGQTPKRINSNIGPSISPIFTSLNSKTRFLPQLPTSPRRIEFYEENKNTILNQDIEKESKNIEKIDSVFLEDRNSIINNKEYMSSIVQNGDNFETMETLEVLRKRLNEKNQEIHFLRKTVKDLEIRMNNFENKEKIFVESEISTKKKIDELLIEKQEFIEKLHLIQNELIKLQEEKTNVLKENKCLSSNLELKNYEMNKLNNELIYLQTTYKNNFISKYLTPIKNILYEFINEIEDKVDQKVIINVDFNNNNLEMDVIIKTLHEYINHLKNIISSKISEDFNIIEKLHHELNKVNKQYSDLKFEYEEYRKKIINGSNDMNINEVNAANAINEHIDNDNNNNNNNNNNNGEEKIREISYKANNEFTEKIENKNKMNFGLTSIAKSLLSYTYIGGATNKNNENQIDDLNLDNLDDEISARSRSSKRTKRINNTTSSDNKNKKVVKNIEKKKIDTKAKVNKKSDSELLKNIVKDNLNENKKKIKKTMKSQKSNKLKDSKPDSKSIPKPKSIKKKTSSTLKTIGSKKKSKIDSNDNIKDGISQSGTLINDLKQKEKIVKKVKKSDSKEKKKTKDIK